VAIVLSATAADSEIGKACLSSGVGRLLLFGKGLVLIFGFGKALVWRLTRRHDTSCVRSHSSSLSVRQC